jgi:hypothetical protein
MAQVMPAWIDYRRMIVNDRELRQAMGKVSPEQMLSVARHLWSNLGPAGQDEWCRRMGYRVRQRRFHSQLHIVSELCSI